LPIIGILALVSVLSSVLYLAYAWSQGVVGFPLDDAWIHQTYARSLAQTGQLAYLPGQPSAGSTSPTWSFILSVAYMLKIDFHLWTYLIGCLALAATAWLTYRLFLRIGMKGKGSGAALLAGLLCAVEWHLVWASVSGMETILFTALSLGLLEYYFSHVAAVRSQAGEPASVRKEQTIVRAIGIGLLAGRWSSPDLRVQSWPGWCCSPWLGYHGRQRATSSSCAWWLPGLRPWLWPQS